MEREDAQREEKVGARLSREIHDGCFLLESNKGAQPHWIPVMDDEESVSEMERREEG